MFLPANCLAMPSDMTQACIRTLTGKYVLEMSKLLELDRDDLNGD